MMRHFFFLAAAVACLALSMSYATLLSLLIFSACFPQAATSTLACTFARTIPVSAIALSAEFYLLRTKAAIEKSVAFDQETTKELDKVLPFAAKL